MSRAFSCLSNAQKRAAYDRDGEERAPGAPRQGPPGGGGSGGFDDFDPEEIFNMFFNGGIPTRRCPHCFLVDSVAASSSASAAAARYVTLAGFWGSWLLAGRLLQQPSFHKQFYCL